MSISDITEASTPTHENTRLRINEKSANPPTQEGIREYEEHEKIKEELKKRWKDQSSHGLRSTTRNTPYYPIKQ